MAVQFEVNGQQVEVDDTAATLLDALRDRLGLTSVKDGCSPQGQCGCCTVLVDGSPRVSCVTPLRRVAGRRVTTLEGLDEPTAAGWARAFCATGASQCGFCTPGIVMRLEGARAQGADLADRAVVDRSLAAHLCRCTGWQPIVEAAQLVASAGVVASVGADARRDLEAAAQRAELEGGAHQVVGPEVALGRGGFADDTAPVGSLVAVLDATATPVVAPTMRDARERAAKVQGRRTTREVVPPLEVPPGSWRLTLQTSWVEPAYLETDASWCAPGAEPASPLANGGAFGAKRESPVTTTARALADEAGTAVRVRWSREDVVRLGPKRPPMAIGVGPDGAGIVRVAATPGIQAAMSAIAPDVAIEEWDLAGPPTSASLRGAGWAELAVVQAALRAEADGTVRVTSPSGATASARITSSGIEIRLRCGRILDEVVLRSYCVGAAHMALGWVTSEGLAVDDDGTVLDLTIRSFGIVRPAEMPPVHVEVEPGDDEPVNGSDAVFAAVAAAVWVHQGCPPSWPTGRPLDLPSPT